MTKAQYVAIDRMFRVAKETRLHGLIRLTGLPHADTEKEIAMIREFDVALGIISLEMPDLEREAK